MVFPTFGPRMPSWHRWLTTNQDPNYEPAHKQQVNEDLLAFIKMPSQSSKQNKLKRYDND